MRRNLTQRTVFRQRPDLRDDQEMDRPIDPRVGIGHVHLKVADLERSIAFYSGVLGFELMQRMGSTAAFLSAGGYHHHIGLNTWESLNGKPPASGTTGLYHVAIRYPDRASLGDARRRLQAADAWFAAGRIALREDPGSARGFFGRALRHRRLAPTAVGYWVAATILQCTRGKAA